MNRTERRRQAKLAKKKRNASTISDSEAQALQQTMAYARQLHQAGKADFAREVLQHLLNKYPAQANVLHYLGVISCELDEYQDAQKYLEQLTRLQPNDADALNNLGMVYEQLEMPDKAISHYQKAIALENDHRNAHYNLGNIYKQLGKLDEAVVQYREAIRINPDDRDALYNLANTYNDLAWYDEALKCYSSLENMGNHNAEFCHNMANTLTAVGRIPEAEKLYRQAISLNPTYGSSYRQLARLKKFTHDDPDFNLVKHAFENTKLSDKDRMHLAFALGKMHEDIAEYHAAFGYFLSANELMRKSIDYSLATDVHYFSNLTKLFSKLGNLPTASPAQIASQPVFIVGMPRSGTTLVEQILSSHPEVLGAGELNDMPEIVRQYFDCQCVDASFDCHFEAVEAARNAYVKTLERCGFQGRFITDKMPHNFVNIGFIRLMFPEVKIIHCRRDPLDSCLSIFKNYFSTGGHGYAWNLEELGEYYLVYHQLMESWKQIFPGSMLEVEYEAVIADVEKQTRRMLDYLGLDWDDNCLTFHQNRRHVETASATQVRKPIYNDSVKLSERYAEELKPLATILQHI
ncbi:MAG: sulfotransferase [Chromatiales bacterium]|jgi:tetratricopeptide (TPR) repeat protein